MTVIAERGDLVIRRMRDEDDEYQRIVEWRNRPHVREWWDPDDLDLTVEAASVEYSARTLPGSSTVSCIIEFRSRPVGYIQFYAWDEYEEGAQTIGLPPADGTWGLDIFIGEPDLIDRGIGSAAVDLLCGHLFDARGASSVRIVVAMDNARALRAYEKAGFRRMTRVLDTDTRGGSRVESWLLVR
jgi:aminoglycoside 6'-N-acetyltransferase